MWNKPTAAELLTDPHAYVCVGVRGCVREVSECGCRCVNVEQANSCRVAHGSTRVRVCGSVWVCACGW